MKAIQPCRASGPGSRSGNAMISASPSPRVTRSASNMTLAARFGVVAVSPWSRANSSLTGGLVCHCNQWAIGEKLLLTGVAALSVLVHRQRTRRVYRHFDHHPNTTSHLMVMVQCLSADDLLKKVCPPRMTACSVPLQTNG